MKNSKLSGFNKNEWVAQAVHLWFDQSAVIEGYVDAYGYLILRISWWKLHYANGEAFP